MRILAAIANYGTKNQQYLDRLIDEYRSMSFDIDIIVLSDIPKNLGRDIEVKVGLPARNPWSLPFAHKKIFAERAQDYDLFIYSEDDTLVKQRNIEAFLQVTKVLLKNEIAGFLRYEEDADGKRYCTPVHAYYHWVPGSVKSVGEYTFAYFTNEHSACYILTQDQLKRAIASGGYLVGPHEGRYDMLCTASTDPYTRCGFTKIICISHIQDFLLHHLPNKYVGKMGLDFREMYSQVNALLAIEGNQEAQQELCPTMTKLNRSTWDKDYYEKCRGDILDLVPNSSNNILSIGCGYGATEAKLVEKGIQVVAIPLDLIIAISAESKGIEVLPTPNFERAKEHSKDQKFDCILLNNILQHLPNPMEILTECVGLLGEEGCIIIAVPNFDYVKYYYQILMDDKANKNERVFEELHLHLTTPRMVAKWIDQTGLKITGMEYNINNRLRKLVSASLGLLKRYSAPDILLVAKKA